MEDYEKLYKEAIHRASGFRTQECKDVAEYIFPELKESEGERIRKGIESIIKHYRDEGEVVCPYPFVTLEEALAWLEKQGQQNLEWSKEENDKISNIVAWIKDYPRLAKFNEEAFVRANNYAEWLKSIRNKYIPKKQGQTFAKKDVDDVYIKGICDAKHEFEKLGEQKPQRMVSAEAKEALYDKPAWSDEDEVKINRIVACLENLNVADNDILLKDVDWLKSLKDRYTWKPSEEQIDELENEYLKSIPKY